MQKFILTGAILFFISFQSFGQVLIKGKVSDSTEHRDLHLAVVSLLNKKDTTLVAYTRTDKQGQFSMQAPDTAQYLLLVSFPKFADYMESVDSHHADIGNIYMTPKSKLLDEVIVRNGTAIKIKGDTTEFVADSFKVKQGATVEDLLKQLPGFTVNSKGEIVAQGKRVDKVLVDGEEFFGDDPTMATQNISAKAVDRVQVFETKTEQQQLTGITTGNEGKTVNIKLKEDAKKGFFGKLTAGTDFNSFYDTKAMYNRFVGKKKFSVYGTKTNTNAGSLNWEDRQKLGIENDFEFDEISGFYFSFGGGDDFNDWSLRGLPEATTLGSLYADKWNNDRQNLNVSYRFNRLGTTNVGTTFTQNILPTGVSYSNRYTNRAALNQQHAFNFKYEWKIDSLASLKLVTSETYKTSHTEGRDATDFLNGNKDTINTSVRNYDNSTERNQIDNQLTYKQLFKKKNRIWQTVARYGVTDDDNDGIYATHTRFFNNGSFDHADTVDQQKLFKGRSTTMGIKSTFSEPLSAAWFLVLDYAYNKNHSVSRRNTFEKAFNGKYELPINEFSNNFILDAFSHSGSAILRYTGKKMRMAIGSGISTVKLGLENLDNSEVNEFNFFNVTPQLQVNFMPKPQTNISFNYRGTTRQPTINQLQPLRDNTDPLNEYRGNPDLKVGFNHNISVNFNEYKVLKQQYAFVYMGYNFLQNAITQSNTIDAQGKRIYFPINVNGNNNWYMGANWNRSPKDKKPGYGFNFNGNGGRYINYINGAKAITNSFNASFNPQLSFQKTDKYNFQFGPQVGYNYSKSSIRTSINNNYFTYGGRLDANVQLPGKFEIQTNVNADLRQHINAFSTNTNIITWNAVVSKKFWKNNAGKLSIVANDILNQNKGFNRTINSTFISDDRFQRVSRYFLLRFEWSFTKSPGAETKK
jgi:hypothetical protein